MYDVKHSGIFVFTKLKGSFFIVLIHIDVNNLLKLCVYMYQKKTQNQTKQKSKIKNQTTKSKPRLYNAHVTSESLV